MNKHSYFYLIAGLPRLSLQDAHPPFSPASFLSELRNSLDKKDLALVRLLYYPRDNRNLIDLLFGKSPVSRPEGCYPLRELENGIAGKAPLPDYMHAILAAFKAAKALPKEAEWDARLTEAYFREVMQKGNPFLSQWMAFDLGLKNSLLAGGGKPALTSASLPSGPTADIVNQAAKILDTENLVEREKKIDALRWKKLEDLTFFHYFTVEAILGYVIRLLMLDRWAAFTPVQDNVALSALLASKIEKKIPLIQNSK